MNTSRIEDGINNILDSFVKKHGSNSYLNTPRRSELAKEIVGYVASLQRSRGQEWAATEDGQEIMLTGNGKAETLRKWQEKYDIGETLPGKQLGEGYYAYATIHHGKPLSVFIIREDKLP
jgi:hypothetical protein